MRCITWFQLALGVVLVAPAHLRAESLPDRVERISEDLRQVWIADPLTKGKPYPAVEVLEPKVKLLESCPEGTRVGATSSTRALFCPVSGKILLSQRWLEEDIQRDQDWALAYWIATGLAQAIRLELAMLVPALDGAASNLQANCIAATLMHQRQSLWPSEQTSWDSPAFKAYPARFNSSQGKPSQRSYAFLSGLGITDNSCSSREMADLSKGAVADPQLLKKLEDDPRVRARARGGRLTSPELLPIRGVSGGLSL